MFLQPFIYAIRFHLHIEVVLPILGWNFSYRECYCGKSKSFVIGLCHMDPFGILRFYVWFKLFNFRDIASNKSMNFYAIIQVFKFNLRWIHVKLWYLSDSANNVMWYSQKEVQNMIVWTQMCTISSLGPSWSNVKLLLTFVEESSSPINEFK